MFSVRYTLKQQQLYALTSGQLDVLLPVLHGRDAFVCMATGIGISLRGKWFQKVILQDWEVANSDKSTIFSFKVSAPTEVIVQPSIRRSSLCIQSTRSNIFLSASKSLGMSASSMSVLKGIEMVGLLKCIITPTE